MWYFCPMQKKKKVTNCYTLKQCNLYVGFSPLCLRDLRASWENSSHYLIMISLGLGGKFSRDPEVQPARYGRLPQMNHQRAVLSFTSTLPQPPWGARELFPASSAYSILCYYFLIYKALFLSRYILLSLCPVSDCRSNQ